MAQSITTHAFPELTPDELFNRILEGLPRDGIEIWKSRPIGWLIMAKRSTEGTQIDITIQIRPGAETEMMVSQKSDTAEAADVQAVVETLLKLTAAV